MKKLIFIKLGGSLITDKTKAFSINRDVIKQVAKEIKDSDTKDHIVIGNGAGSFAHSVAMEYKSDLDKDKISPLGFAKIQNAAASLNRIVVDECLKVGLPTVSIHPSSTVTYDKDKNWDLKALIKTIEMNAIPVIYGDIIWANKSAKILSTETLFYNLAERVVKMGYSVNRVILLTDVDGVYDNKNALIKEITKENIHTVHQNIKETKGSDVTGGMLHKVNEALNIASLNIEVLVTSGKIKGNVTKAIEGENRGTRIK